MIERINVSTRGRGLYDITDRVQGIVQQAPQSEGLCTIFVRHTSASLTIQENADPSVQTDLVDFFNRLVPEDDPNFTHTLEGPDDMPAHIKSALTSTSLSIPFIENRLVLGTWQGIYLWEHRDRGHQRSLVIHTAP